MASRLIIPNHITGKRFYQYSHFTTEDNHPFYIGIGTRSKQGYSRSKCITNRNNKWKDKIGNNDYIIIICNESDDYDEIKEMEKDFIQLYKRDCDGGLLTNISTGGEGSQGYRHTNEYKLNLSIKMKGKGNHMYGRKMTDEQKRQRSIKYSGKGNPRYGKVGKDNPIAKRVLKLNDLNDIVYEYESARLAANMEKVSHTSIIKAIKNNTKYINYRWKYGDKK